MPSITVRNLSEDIHRGLRVRAARRGRSMEAELREVLAIAAGVRRPAPRPTPHSQEEPRFSVAQTGARIPPEVYEKLRDILKPAAE